jgi:hypothetical protein
MSAISAALATALAASVPADGIRLGEASLRPFLSLGAGYDSAVLGLPSGLSGDLLAEPSLGAQFELTTPGVKVSANAAVDYRVFAGAISPGSVNLSFLPYETDLDAAFNRRGTVEVQLGGISRRSDRSSNSVASVAELSFYNTLYAALPIHPGAKTFEVIPRVRWEYETFSSLELGAPPLTDPSDISANPALLDHMSYHDFSGGLAARWRFRHAMAAIVDAQLDGRIYPLVQQPFALSTAPLVSTNIPSLLLRGLAGVAGQIVPHLVMRALLGGGGDFGGSGAYTVTGQAELAWVSDVFTTRGGYFRTLNPVPIYGVTAQDRGYLFAKAIIAGQLMLDAGATLDALTWLNVPRHDLIVGAQAAATWQVTNWFAAGLGYRFSFRSSSSVAVLNFVRHEIALTLTVSYGRTVPGSIQWVDPVEAQAPTAVDVPRPPGFASP